MEGVNGDTEVDRGGPPVLSPLTGCYLLIVIGEPHCQDHKDIILKRIEKGLLSWDFNDCHVDLEKELSIITEQSPEGEEAKYGERLIQFASENLVTEVLIHPAVSTLSQCMKNLLSSFTRHRHIIHSGYTFAGNGSWILQDGTFSLADFSEAFQEVEVQRVLKAYENTISLDLHCSPEGDWSKLPRESFTKNCKLRLNPDDVLTSGNTSITNFLNYLLPFLNPTDIESVLESSDIVGNIRFSYPTLYIFPAGQGDAALFGINGFNMLVDGGFSRKACFWNFVRHLDRLDAVLLTRINNNNVGGLGSMMRRKRHSSVYPQIGHFFCNILERKSILSPDGDKDKDPLLVNLFEEGQELVENLHHINLNPQTCYRDVEPINLYHKVGHGTLDMYVLSPARESKEVREFLQKWNSNDQKLFASQKHSRDFNFPVQNLVSICAVLVWQPANINDNITRILFPGSAPQQKVFEGLDKLKQLEFFKYPTCSLKSLAPIPKAKQTKGSVIERLLQEQKQEKQERQKEKMAQQIGKLEGKGEEVKPTERNGVTAEHKTIRKHDSTESEKSLSKSTDTRKAEEVNGKVPEEKPPTRPKTKPDSKPKVEAKPKVETKPAKQPPKKPKSTLVDRKPSPKKVPEPKENGEIKDKEISPKTRVVSRSSPTTAPAKSAKDANNRKVAESKKTAPSKDTPKPEKKEAPERKPISRRTKGLSSAAKVPGSPQKKLEKKIKLEKEGTTDSSTVSTPSADQELKKDISKLTPEELEALKARELADLQEEQEVIKEIEAVFLKSEQAENEMRRIKNISIEDHTDEEYLIIEKEEIEHEMAAEQSLKEGETQKHIRDSEESEKLRASLEGKKTAEDVVQQQKPTPTKEEVAPIEEKLEADKEILDKKVEDEKEMADLKSQPEDKFSTPIESGATTAPTLPEDERMPLEEIKEAVIEEKHTKEETKEKDKVDPTRKVAEPASKTAVVASIKLDRQSQIRDIVKTPDEVADLPVHEEADIDAFEQFHEKDHLKEGDIKVKDEKLTEPSKTDLKQGEPDKIQEPKTAKDIKEEINQIEGKGSPEAAVVEKEILKDEPPVKEKEQHLEEKITKEVEDAKESTDQLPDVHKEEEKESKEEKKKVVEEKLKKEVHPKEKEDKDDVAPTEIENQKSLIVEKAEKGKEQLPIKSAVETHHVESKIDEPAAKDEQKEKEIFQQETKTTEIDKKLELNDDKAVIGKLKDTDKPAHEEKLPQVDTAKADLLEKQEDDKVFEAKEHKADVHVEDEKIKERDTVKSVDQHKEVGSEPHKEEKKKDEKLEVDDKDIVKRKPSLSEETHKDERKPSVSEEIHKEERKPSVGEEIHKEQRKPSVSEGIHKQERKLSVSEGTHKEEKKRSVSEEIHVEERKASVGEEIHKEERKHKDERKPSVGEEIHKDNRKLSISEGIHLEERKPSVSEEIHKDERKPSETEEIHKEKRKLSVSGGTEKGERKPSVSEEIPKEERKPSVVEGIDKGELKIDSKQEDIKEKGHPLSPTKPEKTEEEHKEEIKETTETAQISPKEQDKSVLKLDKGDIKHDGKITDLTEKGIKEEKDVEVATKAEIHEKEQKEKKKEETVEGILIKEQEKPGKDLKVDHATDEFLKQEIEMIQQEAARKLSADELKSKVEQTTKEVKEVEKDSERKASVELKDTDKKPEKEIIESLVPEHKESIVADKEKLLGETEKTDKKEQEKSEPSILKDDAKKVDTPHDKIQEADKKGAKSPEDDNITLDKELEQIKATIGKLDEAEKLAHKDETKEKDEKQDTLKPATEEIVEKEVKDTLQKVVEVDSNKQEDKPLVDEIKKDTAEIHDTPALKDELEKAEHKQEDKSTEKDKDKTPEKEQSAVKAEDKEMPKDTNKVEDKEVKESDLNTQIGAEKLQKPDDNKIEDEKKDKSKKEEIDIKHTEELQVEKSDKEKDVLQEDHKQEPATEETKESDKQVDLKEKGHLELVADKKESKETIEDKDKKLKSPEILEEHDKSDVSSLSSEGHDEEDDVDDIKHPDTKTFTSQITVTTQEKKESKEESSKLEKEKDLESDKDKKEDIFKLEKKGDSPAKEQDDQMKKDAHEDILQEKETLKTSDKSEEKTDDKHDVSKLEKKIDSPPQEPAKDFEKHVDKHEDASKVEKTQEPAKESEMHEEKIADKHEDVSKVKKKLDSSPQEPAKDSEKHEEKIVDKYEDASKVEKKLDSSPQEPAKYSEKHEEKIVDKHEDDSKVEKKIDSPPKEQEKGFEKPEDKQEDFSKLEKKGDSPKQEHDKKVEELEDQIEDKMDDISNLQKELDLLVKEQDRRIEKLQDKIKHKYDEVSTLKQEKIIADEEEQEQHQSSHEEIEHEKLKSHALGVKDKTKITEPQQEIIITKEDHHYETEIIDADHPDDTILVTKEEIKKELPQFAEKVVVKDEDDKLTGSIKETKLTLDIDLHKQKLDQKSPEVMVVSPTPPIEEKEPIKEGIVDERKGKEEKPTDASRTEEPKLTVKDVLEKEKGISTSEVDIKGAHDVLEKEGIEDEKKSVKDDKLTTLKEDQKKQVSPEQDDKIVDIKETEIDKKVDKLIDGKKSPIEVDTTVIPEKTEVKVTDSKKTDSDIISVPKSEEKEGDKLPEKKEEKLDLTIKTEVPKIDEKGADVTVDKRESIDKGKPEMKTDKDKQESPDIKSSPDISDTEITSKESEIVIKDSTDVQKKGSSPGEKDHGGIKSEIKPKETEQKEEKSSPEKHKPTKSIKQEVVKDTAQIGHEIVADIHEQADDKQKIEKEPKHEMPATIEAMTIHKIEHVETKEIVDTATPTKVDSKDLTQKLIESEKVVSPVSDLIHHERVTKEKEASTTIESKISEVKTPEAIPKQLEEVQVHKSESDMERRKKDIDDITKIDSQLQKMKTIISDEAKEKPEVPKLLDETFDKKDLGCKSPKEREEDVFKIVASVAEVLKSDAPLEEFRGKIPIDIDLEPPTESFRTELRETHITGPPLSESIHIEEENEEEKEDEEIQKENIGERIFEGVEKIMTGIGGVINTTLFDETHTADKSKKDEAHKEEKVDKESDHTRKEKEMSKEASPSKSKDHSPEKYPEGHSRKKSMSESFIEGIEKIASDFGHTIETKLFHETNTHSEHEKMHDKLTEVKEESKKIGLEGKEKAAKEIPSSREQDQVSKEHDKRKSITESIIDGNEKVGHSIESKLFHESHEHEKLKSIENKEESSLETKDEKSSKDLVHDEHEKKEKHTGETHERKKSISEIIIDGIEKYISDIGHIGESKAPYHAQKEPEELVKEEINEIHSDKAHPHHEKQEKTSEMSKESSPTESLDSVREKQEVTEESKTHQKKHSMTESIIGGFEKIASDIGHTIETKLFHETDTTIEEKLEDAMREDYDYEHHKEKTETKTEEKSLAKEKETKLEHDVKKSSETEKHHETISETIGKIASSITSTIEARFNGFDKHEELKDHSKIDSLSHEIHSGATDVKSEKFATDIKEEKEKHLSETKVQTGTAKHTSELVTESVEKVVTDAKKLLDESSTKLSETFSGIREKIETESKYVSEGIKGLVEEKSEIVEKLASESKGTHSKESKSEEIISTKTTTSTDQQQKDVTESKDIKSTVTTFLETEKVTAASEPGKVTVTKIETTIAGPSGKMTESVIITSSGHHKDELTWSGKSTPDIAELESVQDVSDLKASIEVRGDSTPPTVPVSPIVREEGITQTMSSVKVSDLRSSTPASDDLEQSDLSSSQFSKVIWESDKQNLSDDDDLPGTPLSTTSQVAASSSSHDLEDDSVKLMSKFDPMSMSLYGALPEDSKEDDMKSSRVLDEADLDFDKAMKDDRGDYLFGSSSPSYMYEVTTAKYTVMSEAGKSSDGRSQDLMTSSFIGELPKETHHHSTEGDKDKVDDVVKSWGKPLGLPSPAPLNDNKGTPKKERKIPPNVLAKNKLNEDNKKMMDTKKSKKYTPVYVDLTYVPHFGNSNYCAADFFRRVRARYYVFSGLEPSKDVYNALLEAKQTWEDKELEVTIIPTYDTDVLGYWAAENEDLLAKHKIDFSPSASRCTINLQDHETSCSAYRLEFS